MAGKPLSEDYAPDARCPCKGCELAESCCVHSLACRDLSHYVHAPYVELRKRRGRLPTREIYRRVFSGA